jgi:hypothetical protein
MFFDQIGDMIKIRFARCAFEGAQGAGQHAYAIAEGDPNAPFSQI